jgi:hypothetical protein
MDIGAAFVTDLFTAFCHDVVNSGKLPLSGCA